MRPAQLLLLVGLCLLAYVQAASPGPRPGQHLDAAASAAQQEEDDVFLLDYKRMYTGSWSRHPVAFYALTVTMTVAMFYMMYVMADRHLTWTLEHLSRYCRLSPDMAGMTFLAFGNGAPDFFTAVFGAARSPDLILGSSVGAGLFIMCVVLGMVILLAKPKEAFSVVRKTADGREEPVKSTLTLPNGSLPSLSPASKRILLQPKVSEVPYVRNCVLYAVCLGFLGLFTFRREVPMWQPALLVVIYFGYMFSVVGLHYYQELQARKAARRLRRSFSGSLAGEPGASEENGSLKHKENEAFLELEELPIYHRVPAAVMRTSWTFAERTGVVMLDVALLMLKAPIDLMFNLTVPPMEAIEDASTCLPHMAAVRLTHRIRAIVCPWGSLFLAGYLLAPQRFTFTLAWWAVYVVSAAALSTYMYLTTYNRKGPRWFVVHVALAFVSCILWIYAISSELVSCVSAMGDLAQISSTIMGIVVLAWGNSFGDLVADVAMAKNGHFETAISAVFCGPIQNVLLTIGTSFLIACFKTPGRKLVFENLSLDMYLALGTLAAVLLLLVVAVPLVGQFRVPRWLGWSLLAIYAAYLPLAVLSGFRIFSF